MQEFNNILILRTDRIGDVVLTTPAIKALRKAYPMARLSMLVTPTTQSLVKGNPYLDEVLLDDRMGRHKGVLGLLRLAREIRQKSFDAVFIFHTKRRYNSVCFLAGVPVRIGYKNEKFGFLLTKPVKDTRHFGEVHEAQYCLDLLKAVGVKSTDLDFLIPIDKEAEAWASQWLSSHEISSGDLIAIHAGASDPAKCWPPAEFAKLIDALQQQHGLKVVLIGSSEIMESSSQIMNLTVQRPLDLTGQTSLAQVTSLLRRSRLLISNDSGPVHLASALGIYVVSLFLRNQPGVNMERWKPLSDKGICLFSSEGLKVEDVLEAVKKVFGKDYQKFFHW